jgi:hypothetical protein
VKPPVDLVVNTFERTYRDALSGGFFRGIEAQNRFRFARRVALINNVHDRADAESRAAALVESNELDCYHVVEDRLAYALERTGLTASDLGRIPHFSDCSLVAVTLDGAPWLLYWDADVQLEQPADWITPSIELMESDPRVFAANPNWPAPTLDRETIETRGDFVLGQGFSDQMYLVRRRDFAAPIYGERCVARLRYPMAAVGYVFEARVDAHMRHHGLVRATYTKARYSHPHSEAGSGSFKMTPLERLRAARNAIVVRGLSGSPWTPRCCRYL